MSARNRLVETDMDSDEALVGKDVNRWLESDHSDSRSSDCPPIVIPVQTTKLTSTSVVGGRTTQADNRFVSTDPTDGTIRAVRRHNDDNVAHFLLCTHLK